jgi:hypothetical protein
LASAREYFFADVARDARDVLGGLRHRGAVVETAQTRAFSTSVTSSSRFFVRLRLAGSDGGAGDHELHPLRPEVVA